MYKMRLDGTYIQYGGFTSTQGVCVGPDGNIWVADAGYVWKVNRFGTAVKVATGLPSEPTSICTGSDGNLWACGATKVYKITTAGVVTTYSGFTSLHGICAGPDGNLWVIDSNSPTAGFWKITTSGVSTLYPLVGSFSGYQGICVGSDGKLWATNFGDLGLSSCTTAGSVVDYPSLFTYDAYGICNGPDGNLWVGTYDNGVGLGSLYKVSTAGTVITSTGSLGSTADVPSVCVGPDANLWVVIANTPYSIKKINTGAGVLATYSVPLLGSNSQAICSGP